MAVKAVCWCGKACGVCPSCCHVVVRGWECSNPMAALAGGCACIHCGCHGLRRVSDIPRAELLRFVLLPATTSTGGWATSCSWFPAKHLHPSPYKHDMNATYITSIPHLLLPKSLR
jgi:hypothetical protein